MTFSQCLQPMGFKPIVFEFTASGSLPGFIPSTVYKDAMYKNWSAVTADLSSYSGRTIRIEFISSDCTLGADFGYAYLDISSNCSGYNSTLCAGNNFVTLRAPYGFQSYYWYSDNTFSTLIGTGQQLQSSQAPTLNSTYPVILVPYAGFGCLDTFYMVVNRAEKPIANAGPDKIKCNKQSVQLGGAPNYNYSYEWSQASLLSNPFASNPFMIANPVTPLDLVLKTTNNPTGCFSYDTVTVRTKVVDTSSSFNGQQVYCANEKLNAILSVNNPALQVQWYQNNFVVPGATTLSFQPVAVKTYSYWALLSQNGCIDSTRTHKISVNPLPKARFNTDYEIQCINKVISFSNNTIGDEPLTYLWKFSDGTSTVSVSPTKTFTSTGTFTAILMATSAKGCKDSTGKAITILDMCGAYLPTAFTPNNDGLNDIIKPVLHGIRQLKMFAVYNRYGKIVFSTATEGKGWDGTYKGIKLDAGIFTWLLEYVTSENKPALQKGTLMLIR